MIGCLCFVRKGADSKSGEWHTVKGGYCRWLKHRLSHERAVAGPGMGWTRNIFGPWFSGVDKSAGAAFCRLLRPYMKRIISLALAAAAPFVITGCATGGVGYHVTAYKPHNPADVRVAVSKSKEQLYVMEGDRCLMAAACDVGLPGSPTPSGSFNIEEKIIDKRSGAFGYSVNGDTITSCESSQATGRYVGYPMPFWCGFAPGYGFHQGYVWPVARTHGCIRMDKQVAPRFWELVHVGTPVNIAETQPEDATVGAHVARPTDYRDPDPSPSYMIGPGPFQLPTGSLLIDQ